jgi:glycosyltransferase involved in cell wall biosynthesis
MSTGSPTRTPGSLRVGLADSVDPGEMRTGSGASASLLGALREVVAEVVPISGLLPPLARRPAHLASAATRLRPSDLRDPRAGARRVHGAAKLGRPTVAARTLMMRRRLAAAGPLDAVVQRASDMVLPRSARVVSFEDSTVLQAHRSYPWTHLQGFSERDISRYAARQRRIYESAVACCCATHWVAESIVGDYGIPAARVFTVGMGRNHEADAPAERDWATPRYLFVGVDWERKNGAALLAAFAEVRGTHPQARLDVVGGHPAIEQPGVVTHGRLSLVEQSDRERLAALYREATVFAMPSLHEPAGLVYVEAAGAGLPSIGTTDGGAATMIGPGGVLVDPRRPEQIVAAMSRLADPETARALGALARAHAELFTWRKVAERLIRAMAIPGLDTSGLAEFL